MVTSGYEGLLGRGCFASPPAGRLRGHVTPRGIWLGIKYNLLLKHPYVALGDQDANVLVLVELDLPLGAIVAVPQRGRVGCGIAREGVGRLLRGLEGLRFGEKETLRMLVFRVRFELCRARRAPPRGIDRVK